MSKWFFILIVSLFFYQSQINAQFFDDFERYNYQQRISPQSLNWITWSEDPVNGTGYVVDEDGIVSNTDYPNYNQNTHFAFSGKQALFIGKENLGSVPQDVVLDLHNKSKGKWELTWKMYVPKRRNKAYYNFQENTPVAGNGNWAIQVFFDRRGQGRIEDDQGGQIVNFSYPWGEWFELKHIIDLDNDHIIIELTDASGTTEIYNAQFLSQTQHLGGVDFFSIDNRNKFYIDDVSFKKVFPVEDVFIWNQNRWEDSAGNPKTGIPDTSADVIIKQDFNVGVSTPETTLNCLNLRIENNATLTIPSQNNSIVSGDLSVETGSQIVVEDDGSFVMLNNSATIDIADPNGFTYIRSSAPVNAYDFTFWATPVENNTIGLFGTPYVYSYNTPNFIDRFSGQGYPQTTGSPDNHDDNGDDWQLENPNNPIVPGKGYAVLKSGNQNTHTMSFSGKPNNGFISVPVALSGDNTNPDDDWNLIGNPYPSAIDARVLINSNINISGTLYFWAHNTPPGGGNNTGPRYNNYNAEDYASFNLSGGTAAGTGGEIPNGYIAAGQGFFMEVVNAGTVTFNNDMRVINSFDENTQFFKTPKEKGNPKSDNQLPNRVWLNLHNEKGAFSQILLAFLPEASDDFEPNYDGIRAGAGLNTKLYSILGNRELAIQGRSVLEKETEIPIGFSIVEPDEFVFDIGQMEGDLLTDTYDILLIDNLLNTTHNLKESGYTFYANNPGKQNDRFTLKISAKTLQPDDDDVTTNHLWFVKSDEAYTLKAKQKIVSLQVFDLTGREILRRFPDKTETEIRFKSAEKGHFMIVKVRLEDGSVISKKLIY